MRHYGLFAANCFGKRYFEKLDDANAGNLIVKAGDYVTFRYRFLWQKGEPDAQDLDARFRRFKEQK